MFAPQRLYEAGARYEITVVGMYEAVLVFIALLRYAAPVLWPGQASAESAAVRKIKMRGMRIPTRPIKLVLSLICINYLLENVSAKYATAARNGAVFPKQDIRRPQG